MYVWCLDSEVHPDHHEFNKYTEKYGHPFQEMDIIYNIHVYT